MLFCNGSKPTSVVVPSGVTKISPYAFYKCTSLTSVTLNDDGSLTQIMNNAFRGCTGLTEIIVPNSVTSIGADAFNACTGLTSLTLGSSLININSSAFNGCTSLAGTLTIPSAVTQISSYAFKNCSSLTALDLTNASALKTISSSSFTGCTNIVGDLYIPAAVTKIENNAFEDLSGITAIFATPTTAPTAYAATFTNMVKTIPFYVLTSDALTSYSGSDKWNVFTNMKIGGCCGATGNETNVLWELNPSTGLLTISGTGEMKDYSSSSTNHAPWYDLRTSVKSIKICDGVTHVGKYAFNNCSNATEVWMSTTVTECGNSAFLGCSSLNNVKYGKTSTPTLSYATNWAQIDFGNYSANPLSFAHSLQVYKPTNTMPVWETVIGFENRSITSIKKFAFYGCTSLTSATLPSDVETIEESAFYGCTQLETVTLPDALTTIGKEAFKNCSKLPSITIPENVTVMTCHNGSTTYSIFGGCANLTTIVWNARNCASDYIKVGTGSGYNYGTPFSGIYSQITSITFGENVERIPNYLCYHMDHLTSVTIPASVTNIGTEAFDACSGTMSVICEGATPPTLASGVFSSSSTKKLYLPHDIDIKAAYRAASGWSSFTEANTFPKIVQFDLNGQTGTAMDPQFFDNTTSKASAPSDPADDGYFVFDKWCSDEEGESPFNFASMNITADMTLFAKWGLNGTLALSETDDN
ncbi:MAG: leucine-rich repeat protein, partial [Paludibacteraceae bacterium]|nr:leucine-rich repeat protein [Paludibacteraceae bacterium]